MGSKKRRLFTVRLEVEVPVYAYTEEAAEDAGYEGIRRDVMSRADCDVREHTTRPRYTPATVDGPTDYVWTDDPQIDITWAEVLDELWPPDTAQPEPAPARPSVPDLMAALEESLAAAKAKKASG